MTQVRRNSFAQCFHGPYYCVGVGIAREIDWDWYSVEHATDKFGFFSGSKRTEIVNALAMPSGPMMNRRWSKRQAHCSEGLEKYQPENTNIWNHWKAADCGCEISFLQPITQNFDKSSRQTYYQIFDGNATLLSVRKSLYNAINIRFLLLAWSLLHPTTIWNEPLWHLLWVFPTHRRFNSES